MSLQSLPRLRAWVDWDGDGWVNKGLATDPRNLITNPLTLDGIVDNQGAIIQYPTYVPSAQDGLYKYSMSLLATVGLIRIGRNVGGIAGNYVAAFIPTATGTYTLQMRVLPGVSVNLRAVNVYPSTPDTVNITQTPVNILAVGSQLVNYTFTVNSLTNMAIGFEIKNNTGSASTIAINKVSIFSGTVTADNVFNVGGELSKYDNIEGDIMSAQWLLGNSGVFDNFPSEGTATLTLDNSLKKFSVESVSSPFYSYSAGTDVNFPTTHYPYKFPAPAFDEGPTISIEVQDETSLLWVEMWRGQIDTLDIGTGTTGTTATISAIQGIFKLDMVKISTDTIGYGVDIPSSFIYANGPSYVYLKGLTAYFTVNKLMEYLLTNYAALPIIPNTAAVNRSSGDNTRRYDLVSPTGTYTLDAGDSRTYTSVLSAWGGDTTLSQAIKDLMTVDQSLFFILRNGSARYIFRDNINTNDPTAAADVVWTDLLTNSDDYKLNPVSFNAVKLDYSPVAELTGVLWTSKTPLVVPAKTTKTFTQKFQYPEGGTIRVEAISPVGGGSTFTAKDANGVLIKQNFTVRMVLKGTEVDLIITNLSAASMNISVSLSGTYWSTAGKTSYQLQLPTSTGGLGTKQQSVDAKLVTTEEQAAGLAGHVLASQGRRFNSFASITISSRDAAWLTRILNATLGTRIKYSEGTFSGGINHRVMIVGESASWTPGILTMTYTTRPADQLPYLNTDTTYYKLGGVVY